MGTIGRLTVVLEANAAQFNNAMNQAGQRTEQAMQRINGATQLARGAIAGLVMGGTAAAFGVIIKGAIDAADNLRDMSMKTGIAVEDLNGLGFAAGQAGGSLESMVAAAGKLNKTIADAAGGGKESSAAFKALGIEVLDANGNMKKADVVMAEVADRFKTFHDGPEKSALALALFSKAGADMIPLLNDGGEAMRANIAYAKQYSGATTELSNMSDNFNDTVGKLSVQQKGFGNAMATAVLPILQSVADELLGATEESNKFATASEMVRTVLETFVVVGSEVAFTFKMVGDEMGGTAAKLAALKDMDFKQFSVISDAMAEDQARARKEHDAFIEDILKRTKKSETFRIWTPETDKKTAPVIPGATGKPKAAGKSDDEKALESGTALVAKLKEQAEAYGLAGTALLTYQLAGSKMPEKLKQEALGYQVTIDGLKAKDEAAKADAARVKQDAEKAKQMAEQNTANVAQIRTGLLSQVAAEEEAHQSRLVQLRTFHDAKLENVIEANALIEAENARHEQVKADMQMAHDQQVVGMAGDSAAQLYSIMQQAGMEQTALGKALFIANKAIAVAEIIMNTEVAAAKALTMGPIIGPPLSFAIRAMGYASAGIVIGTTIASAEGGYDIPRGRNPLTQLHEEEMVLPKAQANVIRGLAKGGGSGGVSVTMINNGTPQRVVETREISPGQIALIVDDAVKATAAQFADPNSPTSRAMARNYNVPRSR